MAFSDTPSRFPASSPRTLRDLDLSRLRLRSETSITRKTTLDLSSLKLNLQPRLNLGKHCSTCICN